MKPLPYGLLGTPWKGGIVAFEAGDKITDNPYPKDEAFEPDSYPGRRELWRRGWLHAKAMHAHIEEGREKG